MSPSIALSNNDDAKRWTCLTIPFHERLLRCSAFLCKCRPRGLITSMNSDACLLLDYSSLQNSTPFTGCSKKLLKINKRSSKPFGLLPFGASLRTTRHLSCTTILVRTFPVNSCDSLLVQKSSKSFIHFEILMKGYDVELR